MYSYVVLFFLGYMRQVRSTCSRHSGASVFGLLATPFHLQRCGWVAWAAWGTAPCTLLLLPLFHLTLPSSCPSPSPPISISVLLHPDQCVSSVSAGPLLTMPSHVSAPVNDIFRGRWGPCRPPCMLLSSTLLFCTPDVFLCQVFCHAMRRLCLHLRLSLSCDDCL